MTQGNGILVKGLLTGFLIIIMLIPGIYVTGLVQEREKRQKEVVKEVSSKWAGTQTITGPLMMVPYTQSITATDGATKTVTHMAYILPDELHIKSNILPKVKKRSLYNVNLYHTDVQLSGRFKALTPELLQLPADAIMWSKARLVISIDDMKGMEQETALTWNGTPQNMEPGVPKNDQMKQGMSVPVKVEEGADGIFSLTLNLRGSGGLYFTPVGRLTTTDIAADWKDPAFDGQYLPDTSDIRDNKFNAHWSITQVAGNYMQVWKNGMQDFSKTSYGVRLISTVDGYAKTMRSVKYAILFIALTFICFFFMEIRQKKRVHPIQYLLAGMALSIFYTLLLAISEYTGFNIAYLIASVATILLIASYVQSIFRSRATAAGFSVALTALYTYIFIIIQSEDYALLFGSIGLFVILAVIMHYSRKVDWYGVAQMLDE